MVEAVLRDMSNQVTVPEEICAALAAGNECWPSVRGLAVWGKGMISWSSAAALLVFSPC